MRSGAFNKNWKPALADLADVHLKRSQINQLLARYDDAFTGLHRALRIGETSGDQKLVITCQTREIHLCYLTGQLERGITAGELALRHPGIDQYPADKAQAYNSMGNIHLRRFDIERAEREFGTARAIYHQLGDDLAEARIVCNLANVSNVRGGNVTSLRLYRQALDIFQRHGDSNTMAHVSKAIGQVLLDMGDIKGARDSLNRSLQLSTRMQDYRRQAACLLDIANLDNSCGRYDDALNDLKRSREIAEAHGIKDPNHWACFNGTLAEVYSELGRWDDAIAALRQMLEISEDNRFLAFQVEGYNLLGLVTVKKTNGPGGLADIERGLAIAREHNLEYQQFSGQLKMAEAHAWLGHREIAIALFEESIPMARKMGSDIAPIMRKIGQLQTAG
jgi:tetratricopeptide (TPR) repeat protein